MSETTKLSEEKFYIVSEEELERLRITALDSDTYDYTDVLEASAACRARSLEGVPEDLRKALIGVKGHSLRSWVKVPEWATHFAELSDDEFFTLEWEEIKR